MSPIVLVNPIPSPCSRSRHGKQGRLVVLDSCPEGTYSRADAPSQRAVPPCRDCGLVITRADLGPAVTNIGGRQTHGDGIARYPELVLESADRYRDHLRGGLGRFSESLRPSIEALIELLARVRDPFPSPRTTSDSPPTI